MNGESPTLKSTKALKILRNTNSLLFYTHTMTAYGRAHMAQRMARPENGGIGRKQARQEVLRRVRWQRAIAARKLVVKHGH
jgi:hypothetical protein